MPSKNALKCVHLFCCPSEILKKSLQKELQMKTLLHLQVYCDVMIRQKVNSSKGNITRIRKISNLMQNKTKRFWSEWVCIKSLKEYLISFRIMDSTFAFGILLLVERIQLNLNLVCLKLTIVKKITFDNILSQSANYKTKPSYNLL